MTPATPPVSPAPPAVGDDATPVAPAVADGIPVRWLAASAPWAAQVGAVPGGTRLEAAIALRCRLHYDDRPTALDATEEWEAVLHPLGEVLDPAAAIAVDVDDRDLLTEAPTGATYVLPELRLDRAATFTDLQRDLTAWLVAERRMEIPVNRKLKLAGRPGEAAADFGARCAAAADAAADAEADALRAKLEARIDKLRDAVETAQLNAQHLQEQAATSRTTELLSGAGSVLGALLGGRRSVRSISGAVNRAATGRARTQRTQDRMEAALAKVEAKQVDLAELEAELASELVDLQAEWDAVAADVETVAVPLERADVTVESVTLVWIPTA